MRRIMAAVVVLSISGAVFAQCGTRACRETKPCVKCAPAPKCGTKCVSVKPCKPAFKWITVSETVEIDVPVKRYVEKQVEVPVKIRKMVPVEVEVPAFTYVEKEEPCVIRRRVSVPETYTAFVNEYKTVACEGTRKVVKKVPYTVDKVVCRTVYDCDPCTGQRVARKVEETIQITKYRNEVEEVPYTYERKVAEKVAVEKVRMVDKWVEEASVRVVKQKVPTTQTKVCMQVVFEESVKTITKAECVVETVKKTVQRTKRVKVPVNPCTGETISETVA